MTLEDNASIDPAELLNTMNRTSPMPGTEVADRSFAQALWKAQNAEVEGARRLFQTAIQEAPDSLEFRMGYAAFLSDQADWSGARQEWESVLSSDAQRAGAWLYAERRSKPERSGLSYLHALLLATTGDAPAALAELQHLTEAHANPQLLVDQAVLLQAGDDRERAEALFKRALEHEPSNVGWLRAYGSFLADCHRDSEAVQTLESARAAATADAALEEQIAAMRARVERKEGARKQAALARFRVEVQNDIEEGATLAARALEMDVDCALAYHVRAEIAGRAGKLRGAIQDAERAIALEPDNGEYQSAKEKWESVLDSRQQEADSLVERAKVIAAEQLEASTAEAPEEEAGAGKPERTDLAAAFVLLERALDRVGDHVEAHTLCAELLLPEQVADAERHLQAALQTAPDEFQANRLYALLLSHQGRKADAAPYLQAALRTRPDDAELVAEYVDVLMAEGKSAEAVAHLEAALRARPTSAALNRRLGSIWARIGRVMDALPLFEAAIQEEPDQAETYREYAMALATAGQDESAEQYFKQALELQSDDVQSLHQYALLLQRQQQYAQAVNYIQRARALRPDDVPIAGDCQEIEAEHARRDHIENELAYALYLSSRDNPGDAEMAERSFEAVVMLDPRNEFVFRSYGEFLVRHNKLTRARDIFSRLVDIVPDDQAAQTELVRLRSIVGPEWEQVVPTVPLDELEQRRGGYTAPEDDGQPTPVPPTKARSPWQRLMAWMRRLVGR